MMKINTWLVDSYERIFPATPTKKCSQLTIPAAKGEYVSFQVALRMDGKKAYFGGNLPAELPLVSVSCSKVKSITTRIRRIGAAAVPVVRATPTAQRQAQERDERDVRKNTDERLGHECFSKVRREDNTNSLVRRATCSPVRGARDAQSSPTIS